MSSRVAIIGAGIALCALPGAAAAAGPLGLGNCAKAEGFHQCSGLVETWDGVPLDTTVTMPSAKRKARPLVVLMHGLNNSKWAYLNPDDEAYTGNAYTWTRRGYNVLTYTARGFWGSCGEPTARLANPVACADGYIRLADVRYDVRDAQELIGRLVDNGYADPRRIGVTGDSGGGGPTLMMGALRDRVMLPDGRLAKWRSPAGKPLEFAALAPVIPWSDLISAAAPNGTISDTGVTSRKKATSPVGVAKLTFVSAIYAATQGATGPGQPLGQPFIPGRPMGFVAPLGLDPETDIARWVARTDLGEPYDDAIARETVKTLTRFHSPYYIKADRPPAPLLISSGFTDDLFPVDEALRFANRTRKRFPDAPLRLLFGDFGHQRAANKQPERLHMLRAIRTWFDLYLRGKGQPGRNGVAAYIQTCPRSRDGLGPLRGPSFGALSKGTLRKSYAGASEVSSLSGLLGAAPALDPVTGGGDGCVEVPAQSVPGTTTFNLKDEGEPAVTLIGSPRIRASITLEGAGKGVASLGARLWDVAPGGATRRLVARGSYRPHEGRNHWFLHPGAWRFERSHSAELELLGADAPFSRPSNGVFTVNLSGATVALPVR